MVGADRQLNRGRASDAEGPPIQRRHPSRRQADDGTVSNQYHWVQNGPHYDQSSSNAPIFNGTIYGGVHSNSQISTVNGLQFLYQHAAMGALHESDERYPPPLCHPGTRDVVVSRIIGWYLDKGGKKGIMWVHAPVGYGKTAVAGTVKERLDAMELDFDHPVGATFFFWRGSPERNSPTRFIVTLAYQLAESIPELGPRVEAAIQSKPGIVKMALELQFVKLIVEPFKSLSNLTTIPNRLVIIDGIDECINSDRESRVEKQYAEDQELVQLRVLDLIQRLQSHHLPLTFLILSRPEAWIVRHLKSEPFRGVVEPLDLYEVGDNMNDVKRFVRAELFRIAKNHGLDGADEEWPEEGHLVRRSQGHMLYASTVIRHIDDPYGDPRQLLAEIINNSPTTNPAILHSTPFFSLYELYKQIMRSCPERNRGLMMEVLEDIMSGPLFDNRVPYTNSFSVLDRLSGRSPGIGLKAIRPLHAILRTGRGNEDITDLFVHSSVREFLQTPHFSFDFAVNVSKGVERMLSNMLDCMASVTMDIIGNKLDDVTEFALINWSQYWAWGKDTFFRRSKPTHLRMLEKVIALDLSACIIQTYYILASGPPVWSTEAMRATFVPERPSNFFVEDMDLRECAETLSIADKVTHHCRSSLTTAFIFLLQATSSPSSSPNAISRTTRDCVAYLNEVVAQADWRDHKLVQALGTPGPGGMPLFKTIIRFLHKGSDGQDWRQALLEHIYQLMVRERNPILEEEPLRHFLAAYSTDSESDSEGYLDPVFHWSSDEE